MRQMPFLRIRNFGLKPVLRTGVTGASVGDWQIALRANRLAAMPVVATSGLWQLTRSARCWPTSKADSRTRAATERTAAPATARQATRGTGTETATAQSRQGPQGKLRQGRRCLWFLRPLAAVLPADATSGLPSTVGSAGPRGCRADRSPAAQRGAPPRGSHLGRRAD
jgi:hypothetical protein